MVYLDRDGTVDRRLVLVCYGCPDRIGAWRHVDIVRRAAFLPGVACQRLAVAEIPADLRRQSVEFDGERHPIADAGDLRRMGIYVDGQCLCSSLDYDIVIRRDGHFTAFLGLDGDDRMIRAVLFRGVVSVGMRDDGL